MREAGRGTLVGGPGVDAAIVPSDTPQVDCLAGREAILAK